MRSSPHLQFHKSTVTPQAGGDGAAESVVLEISSMIATRVGVIVLKATLVQVCGKRYGAYNGSQRCQNYASHLTMAQHAPTNCIVFCVTGMVLCTIKF